MAARSRVYVVQVTGGSEERARRSHSVGDSDAGLTSLTDNEVAWLDAVSDSGAHAMGMSRAVQEVDSILVTDGPLKGREVQITKVDRHKRVAWIAVRMLGCRMPVKVGLEVTRKVAGGTVPGV